MSRYLVIVPVYAALYVKVDVESHEAAIDRAKTILEDGGEDDFGGLPSPEYNYDPGYNENVLSWEVECDSECPECNPQEDDE
jgi:hypothetical protein